MTAMAFATTRRLLATRSGASVSFITSRRTLASGSSSHELGGDKDQRKHGHEEEGRQRINPGEEAKRFGDE